jgi:hypothetical protein
MKDNKLIAEFMGSEWHKAWFKDVCIISPSNISYKFHNSWDWLMPVVGKISSCIEEPFDLDGLKYAFLNDNIEVVYDKVVELIKQLNKKS